MKLLNIYEGLLNESYISDGDLVQLEKELDRIFAFIGVDIVFTRHFMDRVKDVRNQQEITIDELRNIFKNVYRKYSDQLKQYGDGFEGVFKDRPTDLNIPFAIAWDKSNGELDLVNKTIMRKKNFRTTSRILSV